MPVERRLLSQKPTIFMTDTRGLLVFRLYYQEESGGLLAGGGLMPGGLLAGGGLMPGGRCRGRRRAGLPAGQDEA
jgi:hypothetical protein